MSHFWFTWVWPSLKGNGPEDIISMVSVGAVTVVLWPPARRAVHRFFDTKHDELHRKLDHLVEHLPDVPPLPPKESP